MKLMIPLLMAALPAASVAQYGNAAARQGTLDGSPVHSRRALDAAEGTEPGSAAVTLLPSAADEPLV